VAEQALHKTPAATRKPRQRAAQLKLAGIATIQGDAGQEQNHEQKHEQNAPKGKAAGDGKLAKH
jgi:ribonuclease-3